MLGEDLEETFGTEVLNAAEVATSRKSDGHAVPALVVNGPGLGRVNWVQPVHQNGTAESRVSRADRTTGTDQAPAEITPEKIAEKTAEEKRKPYDKRRRQVVIEAVKSRLEALAAESDLDRIGDIEGGSALTRTGLTVKTLVLLAALLSEYGWRIHANNGSIGAMPDGLDWESLGGLKNHEIGSGETREAVYRLCWELIRLVLGREASRLSVAPGEMNNHAHYAEAEILCVMLGFDLAALRAEAAATIPYAKLWREEVVDDWAAANANGNETDEEEAAAANGSESR
jgi:hypothetical protein